MQDLPVPFRYIEPAGRVLLILRQTATELGTLRLNISNRAIAQHAEVALGRVGKLLATLEEDGMLGRHATQGRVTMIALTPWPGAPTDHQTDQFEGQGEATDHIRDQFSEATDHGCDQFEGQGEPTDHQTDQFGGVTDHIRDQFGGQSEPTDHIRDQFGGQNGATDHGCDQFEPTDPDLDQWQTGQQEAEIGDPHVRARHVVIHDLDLDSRSSSSSSRIRARVETQQSPEFPRVAEQLPPTSARPPLAQVLREAGAALSVIKAILAAMPDATPDEFAADMAAARSRNARAPLGMVLAAWKNGQRVTPVTPIEHEHEQPRLERSNERNERQRNPENKPRRPGRGTRPTIGSYDDPDVVAYARKLDLQRYTQEAASAGISIREYIRSEGIDPAIYGL